jgi:hypothetical protein
VQCYNVAAFSLLQPWRCLAFSGCGGLGQVPFPGGWSRQSRGQFKVLGFVLEKKKIRSQPNWTNFGKIRMNFGFNSVNFWNVKCKIRFGPHRNGRISPKFGLIRSNPRTLDQFRVEPACLAHSYLGLTVHDGSAA